MNPPNLARAQSQAVSILIRAANQVMCGKAAKGEGMVLATLLNAREYLQFGTITALRGVAYYAVRNERDAAMERAGVR